MAKKATTSRKPAPKARSTMPASSPRAPVMVTAKSPVAAKSASPREITHEMIAKRAYEIYASGRGGSADDNWRRAEHELNNGSAPAQVKPKSS